VAPKNLIGKLADNAIKSLQDPKGAAGKVVVQAKGTAALGKMVAEQVGRSAVSMAAETATSVVGKASGRKPSPKLTADAPRAETPPPAARPAKKAPAKKAPAAKKAPTQKATPGGRLPTKKATAKKSR